MITVLLCIAVSSVTMAADVPTLESDSSVATAGYFQLSWQGSSSGEYLLQEAPDPDFTNAKNLYEGPDTASLVSGRANGVYYYRIRDYRISDNAQAADAGSWSNVVKVEVAHHPLSRAFMFFTLGAIVFLSTLVVVVLGNRAHKQ